MAESRGRRTDEFNKDLILLRAELLQMQKKVAALEARVVTLEQALEAARGDAPVKKKSIKPPGPPPIPGMPATMPALPKPGPPAKSPPSKGATSISKRSFVDISEIAELVDSVPPPRTRR